MRWPMRTRYSIVRRSLALLPLWPRKQARPVVQGIIAFLCIALLTCCGANLGLQTDSSSPSPETPLMAQPTTKPTPFPIEVISNPMQVAQSAHNTAGWYSYKSAAGRYEIRFPGRPMEQVRRFEGKQGKAELYMVIFEDKVNRRAYAISHSVVSPPSTEQVGIDGYLDRSQEGIEIGADAEVQQQRPITQRGYPGREIILQKKESFAVQVRIFYVNNILYQVMVLAEDGKLKTPDVLDFLNSLSFSPL